MLNANVDTSRNNLNEQTQQIEWSFGGLELWHTHQIIVEACLVDIAENAWESEKENAENIKCVLNLRFSADRLIMLN